MDQVTAGPLPGLVVVWGTRAGTVHYLMSDVITIGREARNDIQLDDRGVALCHASIRRQHASNAEEFRIYDLGSSASVQVNGVTIGMRQRLVSGDRITIGRAILEFFAPDE
jgi:pSer/pThr/pTyr-binding forkhead associated (FHA) protein